MVSPLLPLLLSTAILGDLDRPSSRLLDQDFGLGLRPEDLVLSRYKYYPTSLRDSLRNQALLDIYYRPWAELLRSDLGERGVSSIAIDKNEFKIQLDVQQFKPEEIEVKVVDKYIVVSAKHEEKKDEHGLISRQFVRRYAIPENVESDQITSSISSDGVLTIQAPVKELPEDKNERKIKIELTGKPAIRHTEEEKKEKKEDEEVTITTEESTTPEK
jgi:crystallin alpha B